MARMLQASMAPEMTSGGNGFVASNQRINDILHARSLNVDGTNAVTKYFQGQPLFVRKDATLSHELSASERLRGVPRTAYQVLTVPLLNEIFFRQAIHAEDPKERYTPEQVFNEYRFAGFLSTDVTDQSGSTAVRNLVVDRQHSTNICNLWSRGLTGYDSLYLVVKMVPLVQESYEFQWNYEMTVPNRYEPYTKKDRKRVNYCVRICPVVTQGGPPTARCKDTWVDDSDIPTSVPRLVRGFSYYVGKVIFHPNLKSQVTVRYNDVDLDFSEACSNAAAMVSNGSVSVLVDVKSLLFC